MGVKHYDKSFKEQAVKLIKQRGNINAVSRELGTSSSQLSKWRLSGILAPGLIFHSDRGVQYTCSAFTDLLKIYKMTRSSSRKGNCWDNAVAESFFKTIKCELIYNFKQLIATEEIRTEVFEYIECWYNKKRRHSALGNLTIRESYKKHIFNNRKLLIAS